MTEPGFVGSWRVARSGGIVAALLDYKALIIVGPCLITAATSVALFAAWRSLSRAPHILAWATGFASLALAIALRALWVGEDGETTQSAAAAIQVLATVTTLLLAEGFFARAGQPGLLRRTWTVWALAAIMSAALHVVVDNRSAAAAFAATVQGGVLLMAARPLWRTDRVHSFAEVATWLVLIAVAIMRLWVAVQMILIPFSSATDDGYGWIPAIMVEPACIGLVAMFLIASDLCRDLNRLVWTDPLTGIMNRAGFEDAAAVAVRRARVPDRPLSIAIADIDRFKGINDRHGHAAGDAALTAFARMLAESIDHDGVIARIGGEEFAIILPGHDGQAALARVDALRSLEGGATGAFGETLTACFGVAEMAPGESLPSLLDRADRALYRCKENGRNRCALATMQVTA